MNANHTVHGGFHCSKAKSSVHSRTSAFTGALRFSWVRVMVFSATFNNISAISWRSVLLVEETGVNHRPVASH